MNRTSFPAGQVSTSFVKALLMYLEAEKGPAEADAWLHRCHIQRDDLDDETRPMSLMALHDALVAFVDVASRAAIIQAWRFIILPDNLGFWMRVLRGTSGPLDAFSRLDANESEYGRTTRWQTLVAGNAMWRGRVHIAHDPRIEEDGLLDDMRVAQLSAVPALFGYGRGHVVSLGKRKGGISELACDYEVRWYPSRVAVCTTIAGAIGSILGGATFFTDLSLTGQLLCVGATATGGALFGAAWAREHRRRAEVFAQSMRVNALERNLALKETRERVAAGRLEGTVVAGQYRIKQRMGSGASGVIYEACRVRDDLPVAIKLLRAAAAHDAVASDRLRREAEALGLAWHPNVVEMIDHGHLPDGTAYLVMELLEGESLAVRLRNKGALSPDHLLPVALQICEALIAVHAAGVVHRDLKPSNLFIEQPVPEAGAARPPERVKLLDFGIARVEWEETRITNMGAPLGTPGYMSPEQETGGEVDARSDLFALGAVLYECLVGEPPPPTPSGLWLSGPSPTGTGPRAARIKIALRNLPLGWQTVIERALAPSPRDRFQDARAFAHALRELGEAAPPAVGSTTS
ncbi:serine/threonine-protein kinase [Pendulispora albinea]|uniref:Serine/threonine protein kinase n=1 Tax=Pendulispora albinea TaxID=2741071 RepID=A0ABZ2M3W8_9BACT